MSVMRWLGRGGLLAGLLVVAWLALRSAIVTTTAAVAPATALRVSPGSPSALEKLALAQVGQGAGMVSQDALPDARAALIARPIASVPFFVAARAAERADDTAAALRLMTAAIQRDPRNITVRNWLFDYYLRQGDIPRAIVQVDAIMRLRPAVTFNMTRAIAPLLAVPGAVEAMAATLARNPPWSNTFIDTASRTDVTARSFYRLLELLSAEPNFRLSEFLVGQTVSLALARGDTEQALILYRKLAQLDANDTAPFASFESQRPAPFGWTLTSNQSGYAERREAGDGRDLYVEVYNDAIAGKFAAQSMVLPPGRYGLSVKLVADGAAVSAALRWRVSCVRTGAELLRIDQPAAPPGVVALSGAFTVDGTCREQSLALEYDPALAADLGGVQYRDLRIFKLTAAEDRATGSKPS